MPNYTNPSTLMANRCGLEIGIFDYDKTGTAPSGEPNVVIDFANITDISIADETIWATGGQEHEDLIGFPPKDLGTFKISTQIMTRELLALMLDTTATVVAETRTTTIDFTASCGKPKYYTIVAHTVWKDTNNETHAEKLTFWKVTPKRALNLSYTGDGDPKSMDLEFIVRRHEANDKVMTSDYVAPAPKA